MFEHSIKVPRLYKTAAKIANDVKEGVGSVKQLVYENQKIHPRIKPIYALVTTLFQRSHEIENLLKRSQILTKEPRLDPWLTKVLLVELLWGKKRLAGESKPEKTVRAYEQIFKAHLNDVCLATDADDSIEAEIKPRYVRINTLTASLNEAVDGFRDEGWDLCKFLDKTNYEGFLSKVTSLVENEFLVDIHVPNLLIFPPKTEFYKHPAYKNGSIVLQDKASCLPVHILGPAPGSIVLDMCAAPGMKTTQIAAVMNNEGTIYAVEMNPKRFETLNKIINSSSATCVKTVNKDVLTCNERDFPGVQYILVDPSCTGSGMPDRSRFEEQADQQRLQKLAGFQIKILRSALTKYPDAKRVVYSTCSIFPEENEDVVRQVLETNLTFKLVPAKQFVGDTWKNFGSTDFGDIGKYCLYAKPDEDLTMGFFVAVFERLEEGEQNNFFNTKIYNYKKHVQSQEKRRNKKEREFNEGGERDMQQSRENVVENVNEDANVDVSNNIGRNVKGKKKKNTKNNFIGNDENWTESNNNVEDNEIKSNGINENMEITRDNSNHTQEMEGVSRKKRRRKTAKADERSDDKTENILKENDKKGNEGFENHDEENIKPVEHKKKKKKKETHTTHTETVSNSNETANLAQCDIECSTTKTQTKKRKRSTELHDSHRMRGNKELETTVQNGDNISVVNESSDFSATEIRSCKKKKKARDSREPDDSNLELIEESDVIKKKKKKRRVHGELETTVHNGGEVSVVNDNSKCPEMGNHVYKKKKKKSKKSDGEFIEAVTESNAEINREKYNIEFSVMETQIKKAKRSAEPDDKNVEMIEESGNIVKKKKKKHRGTKNSETTVGTSDQVSIANNNNAFHATEINISKKKQIKEPHIEIVGAMIESNRGINQEKDFALGTQIKKVRGTKPDVTNLELVEESGNIIKKKKKKHRKNKESETTVQNNNEANIVIDNSDFLATEIQISKKKKKYKDSQGDDRVSENNDLRNIKEKKIKSDIEKVDSNSCLMEVETVAIIKKKKKISNC